MVKEVSLGLDTGLEIVCGYFCDSGGLRQELSRENAGAEEPIASMSACSN